MTTGTTSAVDTAAEAARSTYLAEHPEPQPEDFPCPRCGAAIGAPCRMRRPGLSRHAGRLDRAIHARRLRQLDAANLAINEYQRAAGRRQCRTDHLTRYLARFNRGRGGGAP